MIVFAAIAPHSPLLVPTIGKEQTEKLALTAAALEELAHALYVSRADTLVMISPHGPMYPDAMSALVSGTYTGTLKDFGDHGTSVKITSDFLLLDRVHRFMRGVGFPFTLTSAEELDYGYTVPLLSLAKDMPTLKLLPISTSGLSAKRHVEFGQALKEVLHGENARIAVVASADLSHHANANAPQGHTKEGEDFDRAVRQAAAARDIDTLLALPQPLLDEAGQCGFKPIMTLLGCLHEMNASAKELCYEAPFGVGYLTVRYVLP